MGWGETQSFDEKALCAIHVEWCAGFGLVAVSLLLLASHGICGCVQRIGYFCDRNPVQYFHCVVQPDHTLTAVINAVWISIPDPVEFFSKFNPDPVLNCRIRLDRDPETGSCSTLVCGRWRCIRTAAVVTGGPRSYRHFPDLCVFARWTL